MKLASSVAAAAIAAIGVTMLSSTAGQAAPGGHTVAISYFDNNTDQPALAPLAKGLADMLITDLGNVSALQIVERDRLNQVLGELKLSRSRFIDPKTAQKLGRGLAAEFIMAGSYTLVGETLRIDVRVIEVQTGRIRASEKVEGGKDEFFALEKDLVDVLVKTLDVKLAQGERAKLRTNPTQSFAAWSQYSAGLDAKDRGDDAAARKAFQAALDADPNYKAARNATERLRVILDRDDAQKADSYAAGRAALNPNDKDFAFKVDQLLIQLNASDTDQLRKQIELLTWLAQRDLAPAMPPLSRVPLEALSLASRYVEDPREWNVLPRVCEYFISRYPAEDYPKSYCKTSILKQIEQTRKYATPDQAQRHWNEERAGYARTDPDDWRHALVDNDAGLRKLLALYASKIKAP